MIGWRTKGGLNIASSRLRGYIPMQHLQAAGWDVEPFDPEHPERYRCVVFQKAYDEPSLELAADLRARGVRIALDLCDDHFYVPGGDPQLEARSERLRKMIGLADVVSVSTEELRTRIEAERVLLVADAVDAAPLGPLATVAFELRRRVRRALGRPLNLVWFGNPGAPQPPHGMRDLVRALPDLVELSREIRLRLTVISSSPGLYRELFGSAPLETVFIPWSRESFDAAFCRCDLCLLPVDLNPFTACKTANRVILSLLLGLPVVAGRVPSYREFEPFIRFENWQSNIREYARSAALRRAHVGGGQRYIRKYYTPDRVVREWASVFGAVGIQASSAS